MNSSGAPAIILVVLCTSTVLAQQSIVDHCRETSSDADRITCLEAALLVQELQIEQQTEPAGIGAEQVIAKTQTREELRENLKAAGGLQVASYDQVPYERLLVILENGQVWRQIKGDTQKIRVDLKRNQTVDITESSLGGYKLQLNEMRRTVRVERIK